MVTTGSHPSTRTDVVVCLPTYNEAENINAMTRAIAGLGYRVLIIDDNSPDGTGTIADRLAGDLASVTVLHRAEKQGLGPAYAAGFATADLMGAAITCQMDCDFSHDPSDLARLVAAVDEGADVAIGSRYVPGGAVPDWTMGRRLLSAGGNRYARAMLGFAVRDGTAGFRAYRSDALALLDPAACNASGYGFQVEMTYRAARSGFTITEVPITFRDRTLGESKMNRSIVVEAMSLVTRWGFERMTGHGYMPGEPTVGRVGVAGEHTAA